MKKRITVAIVMLFVVVDVHDSGDGGSASGKDLF